MMLQITVSCCRLQPAAAPQHRKRNSTSCRAHQQHGNEEASHPFLSRRSAVAAAVATLPLLSFPQTSHAEEEESVIPPNLDTVTERVYLDFGLCPEAVRQNRTLGDKTILCTEPEALGRIVIGLYGNAAPGTIANFKTLITSQALTGTSLSKIFPGQFIVAGTQGPKRSGLLTPPTEGIERNPDLLSSNAFKLPHLRPGTVSLNLSRSEDDEDLRFSRNYRPLSFLITTGPGPVQSLDGENIVFGRVVEGLDVISSIVAVPTFLPYGNGKAFNDLANFIGDDRASKTKAKWGRPLKAVVITGCGLV